MPTKHKVGTCVLSGEYPVLWGFCYFRNNAAMFSHTLDGSVHLPST